MLYGADLFEVGEDPRLNEEIGYAEVGKHLGVDTHVEGMGLHKGGVLVEDGDERLGVGGHGGGEVAEEGKGRGNTPFTVGANRTYSATGHAAREEGSGAVADVYPVGGCSVEY